MKQRQQQQVTTTMLMMMMKWNGVQLCVICEPKRVGMSERAMVVYHVTAAAECNENNNYSVHIRKAVDSLLYITS
jgi:hypothetical protein